MAYDIANGDRFFSATNPNFERNLLFGAIVIAILFYLALPSIQRLGLMF